MNDRVASWIAFLLIGLFSFAAYWFEGMPSPIGAGEAEERFSAERARSDLEWMTRFPHPVGTAQHNQIRDGLADRLRSLGLEVQLQRESLSRIRPGTFSAARVENVVGRLRGTEGGQALLLAAHYDSAPTAPGAGDDGAGVAAILETLRALESGPALKNDLIVLFSDAEEAGLWGAEAFLSHAWAPAVSMTLNFEGRGSGGGSQLFETHAGNLSLVEEFARTAPYPIGNSLSYEVYRRLPNDTDFTWFKKAGWGGLNFAFIEELTNYHTALDSLDNLEMASLQHHGENMLPLVRSLGNVDLAGYRGSSNAVYFNAGGLFFSYSQGWVLPLSGLLSVIFGIVTWRGLVNGRLRPRGMLAGVGFSLLAIIAAPLLCLLVWWLNSRLNSDYYQKALNGAHYNGILHYLAFLLITVALYWALTALFQRRIPTAHRAWGAMLVWWLFDIYLALAVPGASFLSIWPMLFASASLGLLVWRKEEAPRPSMALPIILFAAPAILIHLPSNLLSFHVFPTASAPWLMVPFGALLGLLAPQMSIVAGPRPQWRAALSGLAAAVFLVATVTTARFDVARPEPNNLFFAFDAQAEKSYWASFDQEADPWTGKFLRVPVREALRGFDHLGPVLQSPAPILALEPPLLSADSQPFGEGGRELAVEVTLPSDFWRVSLLIESDSPITQIGLDELSPNNETSATALSEWFVDYRAVPAEGFRLMVRQSVEAPVQIRAIGYRRGFPANLSISPRPPEYIPGTRGRWLDSNTLVSGAYIF